MLAGAALADHGKAVCTAFTLAMIGVGTVMFAAIEENL